MKIMKQDFRDKFRPYIGHPQTFGSMMRFFPLFDDKWIKFFFVNSSLL